MSDDFLSRWSRRKIAARKGEDAPAPESAPQPAISPASAPLADVPASEAPTPEPPALPPIDSLTADSDFATFMRPEVDPGVRQEALKVLLRDPRFNVMDGLDVYIDDYTQPDPLPEGWLEKMNQVAHLGDYVPPAEDASAPAPAGAVGPATVAAPAAAPDDSAAPEAPAAGPENPAGQPDPTMVSQAAPGEIPRTTT